MQETQINQLENFVIFRDGQLSRWETAKPVINGKLRLFRSNLGRGLRDYGNSFDELCRANSISAARR